MCRADARRAGADVRGHSAARAACAPPQMALWFWGVHMFLAWWLLFILTVLHVVADLYHRIIKRDSLNLGHILPGP